MSIPRWVVFLVAFWVICFGVFRLYIAATKNKREQKDRPSFRKRGMYAKSRRSHLVLGTLYVLMGGVLISMGLGVQYNFGGGACIRTSTETHTIPVEIETTVEPSEQGKPDAPKPPTFPAKTAPTK